MIIEIQDVLSQMQINEFQKELLNATWIDGKATAGHQGAKVKNNFQIEENTEISRKMGEKILMTLEQNLEFISATLPLKVYPPLFNKYENGGSFGNHIDNAIRQIKGTPFKIRTDISATLFLNEPHEYEGGELIIEESQGSKAFKLKAGNMIIYPSTFVHRVEPVTKGSRLASFFWLQSMVKSSDHRTILFELDKSIQNLDPELPETIKLTGIYHNLLRMWSET